MDTQMHVGLTPKQMIIIEKLIVIKKMLDYHHTKWSKQCNAETAKQLRKASNFVMGMYMAILKLDNVNEFHCYVRVALFDTNAKTIVCSIRTFKDTHQHYKHEVVQHRNQLKHEIVGLLEFLIAYYTIKFPGERTIQLLSTLITDFQKVQNEEDVEDLEEEQNF